MGIDIRISDVRGIHNGFNLKLKPGFTALVGPNGAGKTTLLVQLREYAQENKIKYWEYSNLSDGGEMAMDRYLLMGNMRMLATAVCSSEGEKLVGNFANRLSEMGKKVKAALKSGEPLVVLLDSIDSGISIDRAREIRDFLLSIENEEVLKSGGNIHIVMAVNHYEIAKSPVDCVNVRTGEHIVFKSYDEYANFICNYLPKE